MLRRNTGIHRNVTTRRLEFFLRQSVKIITSHRLSHNAHLRSNSLRRQQVITSNHHHTNASTLAQRNSLNHALARRIKHSHEANKNKLFPLRSVPKPQHAQRITRHCTCVTSPIPVLSTVAINFLSEENGISLNLSTSTFTFAFSATTSNALSVGSAGPSSDALLHATPISNNFENFFGSRPTPS